MGVSLKGGVDIGGKVMVGRIRGKEGRGEE